jgi:hypothetical protein
VKFSVEPSLTARSDPSCMLAETAPDRAFDAAAMEPRADPELGVPI